MLNFNHMPPKKTKKKAAKRTKSPIVARMPRTKNETVSVKKISNGYVIRKTVSTDRSFKETEKFVKKKPKLVM